MSPSGLVRARCGGRTLRLLSAPRYISGGCVVSVTWASTDDIPPSGTFPDGSFHPAHVPGFTWDEPVMNLESLPAWSEVTTEDLQATLNRGPDAGAQAEWTRRMGKPYTRP